MNGTAHASHSFLLYSIAMVFIAGALPRGELALLSVLAGILPDIDGVYWSLKNRGKDVDTNSFQHHLMYPTHWPLTYLPLAGWTAFTFFLAFSTGISLLPYHFLALAIGIYAHMAGDSISCGDGLNWGAPWSKRFINLFSAKTDGYHGNYWSARYKKTVFFKLENITAGVSIAVLVFLSITDPHLIPWHVAAIAVLAGLMISGFVPVDKKYLEEPAGGRFNDYRTLSKYKAKLTRKQQERIKQWKERLNVA